MYSDKIGWDRSRVGSGAQVRAFAQSLARYRNLGQIRYLKPADGGITDNFGLSWPRDRPRPATSIGAVEIQV